MEKGKITYQLDEVIIHLINPGFFLLAKGNFLQDIMCMEQVFPGS